MPANYTVNPRTRVIDYILVYPELLSPAAFKQGVSAAVATSDGEVQIVIPAYLNEDHFQRVLPMLPGILKVCLTPCRVSVCQELFEKSLHTLLCELRALFLSESCK